MLFLFTLFFHCLRYILSMKCVINKTHNSYSYNSNFKLAAMLATTLLPACRQAYHKVSTSLLPACRQAHHKVSTSLLPACRQAYHKVSTSLLPACRQAYLKVSTSLLPACRQAYHKVSTSLLPACRQAYRKVSTTVPTISNWYVTPGCFIALTLSCHWFSYTPGDICPASLRHVALRLTPPLFLIWAPCIITGDPGPRWHYSTELRVDYRLH